MVPATVTIPARSPNAAFTVTADSTIANPETVTLTATLGTEPSPKPSQSAPETGSTGYAARGAA